MATHPSQAIAPSHEPLFAAPEPANDDAANTRVWHPCGPPGPASVAATGEFLHGIWDACNTFNDADADFRQVALQGFKARSRDVHERIAHTLVHGETASSGALFTGRKGRSLGQPLIELNTIRMVPDLFVSPAHPSPEPYNEVLVLRHECATMTAKRFDIKSTAGLMAITRHALERIHERSLLNGGDLHDTIRSQLWDVDYSLAFAWSAGLHLGTGRRDRTAATAVPFCDGLLIVQNRIVALREGHNPCEWHAFDRSGVFLKPVAVNPLHAIALPPLHGFEMEGFLVPVAATFIAKDMLRHTQRSTSISSFATSSGARSRYPTFLAGRCAVSRCTRSIVKQWQNHSSIFPTSVGGCCLKCSINAPSRPRCCRSAGPSTDILAAGVEAGNRFELSFRTLIL